MTYPDGEILTYTYDSGGLLNAARGVKSGYTYDYIKRLEYDQFEQRAFIEYGNNLRTRYTYDPLDRRLCALTTAKGSGAAPTCVTTLANPPVATSAIQNLLYVYDDVGNILGLANSVPVPPASQFGGPTNQSFVYDDLYRLTQASGKYDFMPGKRRSYALEMAYDTIHNITVKQQADGITQPSGTSIPQKKTSYVFNYAYNASGPTSIRPHAPTRIGERTYNYDANGNQLGWDHDQNGTRRTIVWDEENRIQSVFDNGHEKTYKYDDQGNRVIKRGPQGETVYVNQYFTMRNREIGTKHVFAGTTRAVSKLMKQDKPGANPQGKTPFEKDLYFFHPDHLGTSNYITDTQGKLFEHLEYFPFGETWVEESTNTQRTPYLFTGKELDEETGLYYFGARYYDPRTSVWQSGDPIIGKYLPSRKQPDKGLAGMGGIFNSLNLAMYGYSHQNPVKFMDPNGEEPNKAQAGVAADLVTIVRTFEQQNPNASPRQVLSSVAQSLERRPDVPGAIRYIYTEQSDWIDAKHFFSAADTAATVGEGVTNILGLGLEASQVGNPSFFSYEDIGSNAAGADFGDDVFNPNGGPLSDQLRDYLSGLNPKLPTDAPNYSRLPARELGSAAASSGRINQSVQSRTPRAFREPPQLSECMCP